MKVFYDHTKDYCEGERQQKAVAKRLLKDCREMLKGFDTEKANGQDIYNRLITGTWHLEEAVNNTAEEACVQLWLTVKVAMEANSK